MHDAVKCVTVCLLFLTCGSNMYAQDDDPDIPKAPIPRLAATAANAAGFAPRGWKVQVQSSGDLNGDGRPDLAFVLHETNPKLVLHPDFGTDNLDTNPRVLGIAFAQIDGSYKLAAQNGRLIPRWTESNMDDYFGEEGSLTVARGAFTMGLHYFANMGGWDAGSTALTFRWQHGRFELIGYENNNLKRNTGVDTKTSINFSTGVKIVNIDTIEDDRRGVPNLGTHRSRIAPKPLRTLDEIGSGFDFEAP
ncbi:hypothetical protein [Terriglobus sp.]|uniref:hypothetical protein n=1 Tax=Terriglobus sp. TaxID=1889013 RepID=UPI003AFF9AB6